MQNGFYNKEIGSALKRLFTNILSDNVEKTAEFYEELFDFKRQFSSDWFILLSFNDGSNIEYGILQKNHESVPLDIQENPQGIIVTFVVDDCDAYHQKALEIGAEIVKAPQNMFYGQRRMLIKDPDGTVIDISSPVSND